MAIQIIWMDFRCAKRLGSAKVSSMHDLRSSHSCVAIEIKARAEPLLPNHQTCFGILSQF